MTVIFKIISYLFQPLFCLFICSLFDKLFFIIYSFLIISPFIDLEDNNSDRSNSESLDEDDADEKRNVSEDLVEKLEEEILDKVFHFHLTLF